MQNKIVSHEDWLKARLELVEAEKAFTRQRDELTRRRMALPWEPVAKPYRFEAPDGERMLADLFGDCSQLIIYHFMFGPDWEEGCKSCSFWADNFNGIPIHLEHRDVAFTAVSRAPLDKLMAYRQRLGWSFPWVSDRSDFSIDYYGAFPPDDLTKGETYWNYKMQPNTTSEQVGISVFAKSDAGGVFHTYSIFGRGVEEVNGAYHFLDMVPKGRGEGALDFKMSWVRRHDQY